MINMFLTALVVFLSMIVIVDYLFKKRRYDLTSNLPGPKIYPIVGNALFLTQRTSHDAMNNIVKQLKQHGPLMKAWGAHKLMIISTDPKELEIIMTSQKFNSKNTMYRMMSPWLRDGLLLSGGQKWHQRRKIITPAFHFKILEDFVQVFDEQSKTLVEKLEKFVDKGVFDIHPLIGAMTLDVIAETAMNTKLNAQSDSGSEYVRAVGEISEVMMTRMAYLPYNFDFIFNFFAPSLKMRQEKARKYLHEFTEDIIRKRKITLSRETTNGIQTGPVYDEFGIKRKTTFLDVLLQSTVDGKKLADIDIREEVDTFMFEGHDTTAGGIGFALYCISRHPHVQSKLFKEIREVVGDNKNDSIDMRQLQNLKYMELVIKESLRLYPSVPLIGRHVLEDTKLNEYCLPKGTDIVVPIFIILRNPDIFPEPDRFLPERHELESADMKPANPFVNIPFSAGPRNCIGQKFAMLELKSTISKVLRHYELLPLGREPQIDINLVIRSTNGIQLGLRRRVY